MQTKNRSNVRTFMTKKRATLKDVAKEAGVNFTLVSKFLTANPQARMTDETRKRIESAVKKLDYRPSAAARALRNGKSKTVGLVVGDLTNPYYAHIADLALRELRQKGYQLLIALDGDNSGEDAVKSLTSREVDAIIFFGTKRKFETIARCPVAINDANAKGAIEINLELSNALDEALSELNGKIVGLFFENSLWEKEFLESAKRLKKKGATTKILPFEKELRRNALREICKKQPDAIITSGWRTFIILKELLKKEFAGYSPKIVLHANCAGSFLKDKRVVGAIFSSTSTLVKETCAEIIEKIESPKNSAKKVKIPARYIQATSTEYAKLSMGEFSIT